MGKAAAVEALGMIAESILAEIDLLVDEMNAAVAKVVPILGVDASIAAEVAASNRANAVRMLTVLARREAGAALLDSPPEAADVVRTVVRRGLDLDVIFHAYRRGQNIAWRRFMSTAARLVPPGPLLFEVLEMASQLLSDYVDNVIARVIADAQREREEVLGGAIARRAETVRLILDGAPIDPESAGRRLGYELSRRHTGLVLWTEDGGGAHGVLESAAIVLARAAGTRPPLTVPAGTTTLWAWLGSHEEPDLGSLDDARSLIPPDVRVAVGPSRPAITGFRSSHAAAVAVEGLLRDNPGGGRLALYRDFEVTALAASDRLRAVQFVGSTLGPLAADTPNAARLRDTLRVYLAEADNAPRAAARLHTHRNTVLQRVARAAELLGYRPNERRLAVELALELAYRVGPRMLGASGDSEAAVERGMGGERIGGAPTV